MSDLDYARSVDRAAGMIRRAELHGFGRNGDAARRGIRGYLLAAQRLGARMPADPSRAERFGDLLHRAERLGVEL